MSSEITDREYSIRSKLVEKLKAAGVKDIKMEVIVNQGRIDLVTEYEIIEIKIANLWKGALGQILSYSKDPRVEKLNKRIHLFGVMQVRKNMIEDTCKPYGVTVTYEDEVDDWCDSDIEEEQSLICEFCGKELSSKNNLKIHQKTTKYCLKFQMVINPDVEISVETCQYCNKNFQYKQRKNSHELVCIEKDITNRITTIKLLHEIEITRLKDEIIALKREKEIYMELYKNRLSFMNRVND